MAKNTSLPKKDSGGTEAAPEAANLSLPSAGDIKAFLEKADRILELLGKLVGIWEQVDPNRALTPQKGDGAPNIPNPPSSGRFHLEANNGTITWVGFP